MFKTRPLDEWCALLEGTCFAPVLSPQEAARHPHNLARHAFFTDQGLLQAAVAPRFDGEVVRPGPIPGCGEHTDGIVSALAQGQPVWRSPTEPNPSFSPMATPETTP